MKWQISLFLFVLLTGCASSNKTWESDALEKVVLDSRVEEKFANADDAVNRTISHSRTPLDGHFDGCYQLFMPNSMYPVICISGTMEEGIGGANARLYVFHTNTNRLTACAKSSSLVIRRNYFEFIARGVKQITFSNIKKVSGSLVEGDAQLGATKLQFGYLSESSESNFMDVATRNMECKNLNIGELKKL